MKGIIITCYKGNLNQDDTELSNHTSENTTYNKTGNNSCWWGCDKKELLFTTNGNVVWFNPYVKQYGDFSEK